MKTYRHPADACLEMIAGTLAAFERFVCRSEICYYDDDEILHIVG
jgi:hypothetical protein